MGIGFETREGDQTTITTTHGDSITFTVPVAGDEPVVPTEIPPPPEVITSTSTTSADSSVTLRPALSGAGPTGGDISVDTDPMRKCGAAVATLREPLQKALDAVQAVSIRAGGFYAAGKLAETVTGTNKLQESTTSVLTLALDAIAAIEAGCKRVADAYEDTDERNGATANDLQQYLAASEGVVNSMGSQE
jgi:hypothetical protein